MTRNKIKHERIADESKRNTTFKNHVERLRKKAEELSVICGAEVGFVIHTKEENNAVLWPSPEAFRERMDKFLGTRNTSNTSSTRLESTPRSSDVMESRRLMNELVGGNLVSGFHLREIQILRQFTNKRMELMEARDAPAVNAGEDNNNNNNNSFVTVVEDPCAQIDPTANDR